MFTTKEKIARLQLIRTPRIGPVFFTEILKIFHTGEAALQGLPDLVAQSGYRKKLVLASRGSVEREMEALEKLRGRFLFLGEKSYPWLLGHLESPPPVLAVLGNEALLQRAPIAIVGSRASSHSGESLAGSIARSLGEASYAIASGFARGIDTIVNKAALPTGSIAVFAGGVDYVYPAENQELYEELCVEGVVLSENPLGFKPSNRHFPRRNRLLAGLSCFTLVIEATLHSGSLQTARHALDFGREVGAVPGSPALGRSSGCNQLIRDGALLVEKGEDIVDYLRDSYPPPALAGPQESRDNDPLPLSPPPPVTFTPSDLDRARSEILRLLTEEPISIATLVEAFNGPPPLLRAGLTQLVLSGQLITEGDGQVSRNPEPPDKASPGKTPEDLSLDHKKRANTRPPRAAPPRF